MIPRITVTDFGGPPHGDLLLLGPSLGTSAHALWASTAEILARHLRVVGWDLPGHGRSVGSDSFTMSELAAAVEDIAAGSPFHYAGVSVGGAVGLQLLLDIPDQALSATLLCTGASIGDPAGWRARAAAVRQGGTQTVLEQTPQRWFTARFRDRRPAAIVALMDALRDADAHSYAQVCEALADFDVSDRLSEITTPVLTIAGAEDRVTPPHCLGSIAAGVKHGRMVVLNAVSHLAPVESPERVAQLILAQTTVHDRLYGIGMAQRRTVLGDAHVDRAVAETTAFNADFQELITQYAWGAIWSRPGLDRRSRSLITITALIAHGHHEELAMHLRAARRNGLTVNEIEEALLQTAIYCGVPAANTAFRIAQQTLADYDPAQDNQ